jgi:hypothetical protein
MNNLSAPGIMISSQLGNEYIAGAKPDNEHASCSDLGVDISCGLPARLRGASAAVTQAPRALPDVCTVRIAEITDQAKITDHAKRRARCRPTVNSVRPRTAGILSEIR